jgi:hypothetical protein
MRVIIGLLLFVCIRGYSQEENCLVYGKKIVHEVILDSLLNVDSLETKTLLNGKIIFNYKSDCNINGLLDSLDWQYFLALLSFYNYDYKNDFSQGN